MNKKLIWIFILILLAIPFVHSATSNVALGSTRCWALNEFSGIYDCNNMYDTIWSPSVTGAWLSGDGATKQKQNASIFLGKNFTINKIGLINTDSVATYLIKDFKIWVSNNSATGLPASGGWTLLYSGQLPSKPSGQVGYTYNITNSTNWGNVKVAWVRVHCLNVWAANGCGLAELQVWNATAYSPNSPTANLSITATSPQTNKQFNTNPITFRANITTNMTSINCSYVLNGAVATSKIRTSPIKNVTFTRNITGPTNNTWTIYCKGNNYQANTTSNYFYFDSVNPTYATTFINGSAYYIKNLTASFNISDDFTLYSYNISIDNIQRQRKFNLNGTFYQINFSNSITSLSPGYHTMKLIYADGHTNDLISDMKIDDGLLGDKLIFTSNKKEISIQNKGGSVLDRFTPEKQTDRYVWNFNPVTKTNSYTFIVQSDDTLIIKEAPNTYLKRWLIAGNKWIDFDVKNEDETISFKRINSNTVEVTVGNINNPNNMEFNSIGELNVAEASFFFYRVNATIQFQPLTVESRTITSNLTVTRNSTVSTSAIFIFNRTQITPTKTSTSTQDIYRIVYPTNLVGGLSVNMPLRWNLTINSIETNSTKVIEKIYQMHIYNCSSNTTFKKSYIFNTSSELTPTVNINFNLTGQFSLWGTSRAVSRNFTFVSGIVNSFSLCMLPNATLNLDYNFQYTSGGYTARNRVDLNTYINKTLQKQRLLLLPTASGTQLTLGIVNNLNQVLQSYEIDLFKWDFPTSTYLLVQSELSDALGYASFFNYNTGSQYKVLVYNPSGKNLFDSGRMYFINNPTIFKISDGNLSSILGSEIFNWRLRTDIYNKSTLIVAKWNTLMGTTGTICMNVTRTNVTGTRTLASACSQSSSGNMTYNFSSVVGGVLTTHLWVKGSKEDVNSYSLTLGIIQRLYDYIGKDGLILYILLVVIAAAVTITNVQTMPFALGLAHIASWYFGLIPGSIASAVIVVCIMVIVMFRVSD